MRRPMRRIKLDVRDFLADMRRGQLWLGPIIVCTKNSYFRSVTGIARDELENIRWQVDKRIREMR